MDARTGDVYHLIYTHVRPLVSVGDDVSEGQTIASVALPPDTSRAVPHLHLSGAYSRPDYMKHRPRSWPALFHPAVVFVDLLAGLRFQELEAGGWWLPVHSGLEEQEMLLNLGPPHLLGWQSAWRDSGNVELSAMP